MGKMTDEKVVAGEVWEKWLQEQVELKEELRLGLEHPGHL
jgi:hypothetical protein